ncbi:hypothetical protein RGQ15_14755 [Paracoccus sp. MBLB3053]|uniref:DUF2125 domain-containing protein n=1 Tax=Paracoccus aurantius TaxID=3073814 RepID=A0ABU2HUU8_9RHOB|nr:hypothetical protein [Paracoccus sp. MBLB3053]MDS9468823.1 hypothetical protein [Paracoccus sp. MBLB3053]
MISRSFRSRCLAPSMRPLALALAVISAPPASAETPREIDAFTRENLASCKGAGGNPKLLDNYLTAAGDLDGDGRSDYVTDLAGLECANAWSFFCGSAGCPVTIWLSGPERYRVAWGGNAQAWTLRGKTVILSLHGQLCKPPRIGADGCKIEKRFDQAEPPTAKPAPVAAAPRVAPTGATRAWRTRQAGSGPVIAEGPGTGILIALSALCLRDRPVIMAALSQAAGAPSTSFTFQFAESQIEVPGIAGTATQKTYILDPRSQGLAAALSGAAAGVTLHIAGKDQGVLSLSGSTKALRQALSPCLAF